MKPQPTLTTERLILRPCVAEDADAIQRLVSDVEIARNTLHIPHPYPEGGAAEWIAKHAERLENEQEIVFGIVVRDSGELVGVMGLVPKKYDRAEIGYWIGVPYWGRGYATEAARAVIGYAFEQLGFNRVEASHFARNPASGRVMQKAGMKHEGTMREAIRKGDEYLDTEMYAVLAAEWRRAPG
jgi:ribosomal-protein-alanine N-acetyltransferase